jgi:hypothetical protein
MQDAYLTKQKPIVIQSHIQFKNKTNSSNAHEPYPYEKRREEKKESKNQIFILINITN